MGSFIEINDTLQITTEQGFPPELDLAKHREKPFTAEDFSGRVFEFRDKPDNRIFQAPPTRVWLVHNIGSKWLYWGHAFIIEVTRWSELVDGKWRHTTSGKFVITRIYDPEYQRQISREEPSEGKKFTG